MPPCTEASHRRLQFPPVTPAGASAGGARKKIRGICQMAIPLVKSAAGGHFSRTSPRYPSHDAALLLPEAPERKSEASARWPFHWQNPPLGGIFANRPQPITPPKIPSWQGEKSSGLQGRTFVWLSAQHRDCIKVRVGCRSGPQHVIFWAAFE